MIISRMENEDGNKSSLREIDSGIALQLFLDRIAISSIPGITNNSPVLELRSEDCLSDAVELLYEKNVLGALIADVIDSDDTGKFSDRYIGFIDFATMLLWCLQKCDKVGVGIKSKGGKESDTNGFFSMIKQTPEIGQTKVGELAKSFLWDPFFPVYLDDTLFHVLLLFSNHRLEVVPVINRSDSRVIGFVTQNAVVQLLLQSSGLEWFDKIADKALSEFRFGNDGHVAYKYGDESVADALQSLWENRVDGIPVVDRETKKLIGNARNNSVELLLDNNKLFHSRKSMTMEEFIHLNTEKIDQSTGPTIEGDLSEHLSTGILRLKTDVLQRMDSPVTNTKTDTLKQAMKIMVESKSNRSFIVDKFQSVTGVITLRDITMQFSPPSVDSSIKGGGFFESALEQTGCQLQKGKMICDH